LGPNARPRLLVSRCLGFAACRYDGAILREPFLEELSRFTDVVTVCPEVEIGLGVPRSPVRLVASDQGPRLVQPESGRDVTSQMDAFAKAFLDSLGLCDGAVLKAESPSCGLRSVRLYASAERGSAHTKAVGAFGGRALVTRPTWAVEDEGRLENFDLRQHFLTRLFAAARLRAVAASGRMADLVDFHARHKLLLMVYHQTEMRAMGRLVADGARRPFAEVTADYARSMARALDRPPRRTSAINALEHAFGYVSDRMTPRERTFFLATLSDYRAGRIPLAAPVRLAQALIVRFDVGYLANQVLFHPFPDELAEVLDSGKGKPLR